MRYNCLIFIYRLIYKTGKSIITHHHHVRSSGTYVMENCFNSCFSHVTADFFLRFPFRSIFVLFPFRTQIKREFFAQIKLFEISHTHCVHCVLHKPLNECSSRFKITVGNVTLFFCSFCCC